MLWQTKKKDFPFAEFGLKAEKPDLKSASTPFSPVVLHFWGQKKLF